MNIAGWSKLSTVDWPGNLVATLFLQGCPWRCNYCHNSDILDPNVKGEVDFADVMEFLGQRIGLLDGVVFSGGEALMQANNEDGGELLKAIRNVRAIRNSMNPHQAPFKIGLHTAGFWPEALRKIIREVDWIGFDIKANTGKYDAVTNVQGSEIKARSSLGAVLEEIEFRKNTDRPLEVQFRTTVDPFVMSPADVELLIEQVKEKGIDNLVLQEVRTLGAPAEYVKKFEDFQRERREQGFAD